MLLRARALLFTCLLISSCAFAQQKWPNTLLWRISGRGLTQPSYLYGTIHLQDKRLFQFGDSLYRALEQVQGFALEINFRDFMDSVVSHQVDNMEDDLRTQSKMKVERKKLDRSADSLLKRFGIQGDQVSKKDLKRIHDYRLNQLVQHGEMQTIVDGYLYGLALRQGKWIGGIEDVNDQLGLLDEMGGELSPSEVLQPETDMRNALEKMIGSYVSQDLQTLSDLTTSHISQSVEDELLIRRNVKMARRMDSLSAFRTMFFAVGAAHLPGDSGVIRLLRSRGFTVEPVFSHSRIGADIYAATLSKAPWTTVEDSDHLYTVNMPGPPSDFNVMGQVMKMKMFFDLTTMTMYMIGETLSGDGPDVFKKVIRSMEERMGASAGTVRQMNGKDGSKGIETNIEAPEGAYRLQLWQKNRVLYTLLAGSGKKSNLASADVSRFFSSFTAHEVRVHPDWTLLQLPEKGMHVRLPGEAKPNLSFNKKSEGTAWDFTTYDYADNTSGLYYIVQVRELRPGYFLENENKYFDEYRKSFGSQMGLIVRNETGEYHGRPVLYYDGRPGSNSMLLRTMHVVRGNRVYMLLAVGDTAAQVEADAFFHSLELDDYTPADWSTQHGNGFYTTAPGPVIDNAQELGSVSRGTRYYVTHDPREAVSYQILQKPLAPLFWSSDTTAFFSQQAEDFVSAGDSILERHMTTNGSLPAVEMLVRTQARNNVKKLRLLVSGDSLYVIIAHIPTELANDPVHRRFFDDFRVERETPPTVFASKADRMLEALVSKDSATVADASVAFNSISFTRADLPFLHRALLAPTDPEDRHFLQYRIALRLMRMKDSSTTEFVRAHYMDKDLPPGAQYRMLHVLAGVRSAGSYAAIGELLQQQMPAPGSGVWPFASELTDSIRLTAHLFPALLRFSSDTSFLPVLGTVLPPLLDSNLVAMADIQPYAHYFIEAASKDLTQSYLIDLLERFNDEASNALLQRYALMNDNHLRESAIYALVRNGQPVDASLITKLAADRYYRLSLYDFLKEQKKTRLFPAQYVTQRLLAESGLVVIATEDNDSCTVNFIGERLLPYHGRQQRFLLFRVAVLNEGDDPVRYLGIAGPYAVTATAPDTSYDHLNIFWSEPDFTASPDALLKKYLDRQKE